MDSKGIFLKGLICGALIMAVISAAIKFIGNGGIEYSDIKKLSTINKMLSEKYVEEYDKEKLIENMYKGYVSGIGDRYTSYMTKEEMAELIETAKGSFYGVGLVISANLSGDTVVLSVIEDTPAEEAGIKAGDILIEVNGENVSGKDLSEVTAMVKGELGTSVNLSFFKRSEDKKYSCDIKRDLINMPSVYWKMLEDNIGYIKMTQFAENTDEQFSEALSELREKNMKALILDLRNNLGGRFDVVQKITDMLVPEGVMVYTIDKDGRREDAVSDAECLEVPLCVLVNGYTASASEVLSGAVQDMGVGVLVGTQTFGKGLVQGLYTMEDGSGLKITVEKYYTPNGVCIHGEGLTPDYEVNLSEGYNSFSVLSFDEDTQLQKAVEILSE